MKFEGGYLHVGAYRGAPIRLHWTIALGAVFFGGFRFVPVFWFAFFGLILVHEMGHAMLVRWYRLRLLAVDVHGFGGLTSWVGTAPPIGRAVIAWGGVLAQLVVLAIAGLLIAGLGHARTAWLMQIEQVAVRTNIAVIVFNLLPIPPLDGAEAWKLFPLVRARWRKLRLKKQASDIEAELDALNAIDRAVRSENREDFDPLEQLRRDCDKKR